MIGTVRGEQMNFELRSTVTGKIVTRFTARNTADALDQVKTWLKNEGYTTEQAYNFILEKV